MALVRNSGLDTVWLIGGAASIALHVVIIALVLCCHSCGRKPTEAPPPLRPASGGEPAATVEASPQEPDPVVSHPAATPPAATPPAAKPPAVKQPAAKPHAAKPPAVKHPTAKPTADRTVDAQQPARPAAADAREQSGEETDTYEVKKGDTLTAVAKRFGCTNAELAKLNGVSIKEMANLKVGQKIKVKAKVDR